MILKPLDYSNLENWARFEKNPVKAVDTIWIHETLAQTANLPNGRVDLTCQNREFFRFLVNRRASIFDDFSNVYAFYYREVSLDDALKTGGGKNYLDLIESSGVLEDVWDALDYYFEYVNNGRPFLLSGHSQGSAIIQKILENYMKKHPKYLELMIAAYAVGFSVTNEWLKANPHIKFAEGETDTGVVISWNTEGPGATKRNFTLQPGTVLINPINWRRDETPASAAENKGSKVSNLEEFMSTGQPFSLDEVKEEVLVPGIADAQIDLKRGAVISTTVTDYILVEEFGDRSLHINDWEFYYGNVRENMQKRIAAFMQKMGK